MTQDSARWQVWVDTGGTFTDCIARTPEGASVRCKVLSSSALRGRVRAVAGCSLFLTAAPAPFDNALRGLNCYSADDGSLLGTVVSFGAGAGLVELGNEVSSELVGSLVEFRYPGEAPVLAAHIVTQTPPDMPLPPLDMRLGTTRGTNALLEHKTAPTALLITSGFEDLLLIGTQQRPDLFALDIVKPQPLYSAVTGVQERIGPDGAVLKTLSERHAAELAARVAESGVASAAVALMHSWRNNCHEQLLAKALEARGLRYLSLSSELCALAGFLPRAVTTVVNAALSPVVRSYVEGVQSATGYGSLKVMTSAGGLVTAETFQPKDSLLSGPAGGVVGAALSASRVGCERIIAFDMGGTSTDVSRFDRDLSYVFEHTIADARLFAPALDIESVAAGGGSICSTDGYRLSVGPDSCGAVPGPACYGAGGALAITDVNLLLGRLCPDRFGIPVDIAASQRALDEIIHRLHEPPAGVDAVERLLEGFVEIADERMADAIRRVSVRKGYPAADHALVAFGGAGPMHACGVAARLGISTVLVPPDAGLLSALGLGNAVSERIEEKQVLSPLSEWASESSEVVEMLYQTASDAMKAQGCAGGELELRRVIVNMRYAGQESTLAVEMPRDGRLREAFEREYTELFGHRPEGREIEVESVRVIVSEKRTAIASAPTPKEVAAPVPLRSVRSRFEGHWHDTAVYDREMLPPGSCPIGPALVFDRYCSITVPPGWLGFVLADGTLRLTHAGEAAQATRKWHGAAELELFTNRFRAIVTEMGEMLRRTAVSTNVKDRLDFSCALLDPDGRLVANAPHIPVHLGAMGMCVREVVRRLQLGPGDVAITNAPAAGGSHLPDITVVTPAFSEDGTLLGYLASRAHHAEIGGIAPGSMSPEAKTLAQEGVVIEPRLLVRAGESLEDEISALLTAPPWPSRKLSDNLADIRAAVAANHRGAASLRDLCTKCSIEEVRNRMDELRHYCGLKVREALAAMSLRDAVAVEYLDDGTPIEAAICSCEDRTCITVGPQGREHPGNLNATPAIVSSAVMYFLRLLVSEDIPLNDGVWEAVELSVLPGVFNPDFTGQPGAQPPVFGGNVETSQRLVDTLLKSARIAACSQGTMNNVVFGDGRVSYYETVCGGAGATACAPGASAVHTHMTNTRMTDPEILELRFPALVEEFSVRRGSGGAGKHKGGDGVVRRIRFCAPLELCVLSSHREQSPYGLDGGCPGAVGRQQIVRADGSVRMLRGVDHAHVAAGDLFVLETPGGGGWGTPDH